MWDGASPWLEKSLYSSDLCRTAGYARSSSGGAWILPVEDGCYENPLCCRTVSSGFKKTNSNNGNGNNICASKFQHCVDTCEAGGVYTCDSVGSDICTD